LGVARYLVGYQARLPAKDQGLIDRNGRPLKILPVVDEFTRECLVMLVGRSLAAVDVIKVLAKGAAQRGMPEHLRSDNGPEFIADAVKRWLA
jgi:putative transposase